MSERTRPLSAPRLYWRDAKYRHAYRVEGSNFLIIKTEGWERPRKGTFCLWEIAEEDRHGGGLVVSGINQFTRLKDAAAWLRDHPGTEA